MASFDPILKEILRTEGGWVNDKDDSGGETWQGVARNVNPRWSGWFTVDAIKAANPISYKQAQFGKPGNLDKALFSSPILAKKVYDFYKASYWDVNNLDLFSDQQLARNVADCGVNCGTETAARMLQNAINKVTPGALKVDGAIGNGTLSTLSKLNQKLVYGLYNELRAQYYNAIIARKPSQVKYKKSWFSRIVPYKS